jgi:hypothetical protein
MWVARIQIKPAGHRRKEQLGADVGRINHQMEGREQVRIGEVETPVHGLP